MRIIPHRVMIPPHSMRKIYSLLRRVVKFL
jgi:hypothetical protein